MVMIDHTNDELFCFPLCKSMCMLCQGTSKTRKATGTEAILNKVKQQIAEMKLNPKPPASQQKIFRTPNQ